MDHVLRVEHESGDHFTVAVRQHVVEVDQPVADGGEDAAPTPTELFVASLASCVAFYARRFLVRHRLPADGLSVSARFELGERPARVGEIVLSIRVPSGVPEERRAALLAVASHCTVHNSLVQPPRVAIDVAPDGPVPPVGSGAGDAPVARDAGGVREVGEVRDVRP